MKLRKPSTREKQIYKLASSLVSDQVEVERAILLAKRILDVSKDVPTTRRRKIIFRSVR